MQTHRIGNDFTKSYNINLLPGIKVDSGYFTCHISYMCREKLFGLSDDSNNNSMVSINNTSFHFYGGSEKLMAEISHDVINLSVTIQRHNSFPSGPPVSYHYNHYVGVLFLLSLAEKLINS